MSRVNDWRYGDGTRLVIGERLAVVVLGRDAGRQPLVGRAGELSVLTQRARRAVDGRAVTTLISGEAGVGKTALVREVCRRVAADADVLWARCLPLSSLAVPFLPLTAALRDWAAARNATTPVFRNPADRTAGDGPVVFDAWLDRVCRDRPVLLIVDDLQWADQSSLDVLMYVIAGTASRRLATVATMRSGAAGPGLPLLRWLADVRRLPGVEELRLDRLDRVATAGQLAGMLGGPPHESLVDDVFARTHGNAYLTVLLTRGLAPDTTSLPVGLPGELRDAAAHAWHGLSRRARELARLVAVAGRPQRADQLGRVASAAGFGGELPPLLREAVDGGVLEVGVDGRYWFVHPLLAEVLEEGLLPEERWTLHAAFAAALEQSGSQESTDVDRVVDLADHHHRAGHAHEAYRWALRGAAAAERAGGATESLRLLRRALDLQSTVPAADLSERDLLQRIRDAAERAGEHEDELSAVEELLAAADRERDPLWTTELLVRRMHLRFMTGREFFPVGDMREAVRLSGAYPDSAEYALAMAELADAELWQGLPTGADHAREAVRLARACGSDRALTYALVARVMARWMVDEGGSGHDDPAYAARCVADAEQAQAAAARERDFFGFVHATLWAANSIDCNISRPSVEYSRRSREAMTLLGAPHAYLAWLCATEAAALMMLGDWRACVDRLRVALGASPGPLADTDARLTAALLACWQGRPAEAEAHLARAEELFAEQSGFLVFNFDAVRAELAVAGGDSERAMAAALAGLRSETPPIFVERLVPLAARALADEARRTRDRGEDPAPAVARLNDLRRRYPSVAQEPAGHGLYSDQVRAMQAWYDAEMCRGTLDPEAGAAWLRAAAACHDGQLAWDEAYAQRRAAEALLPDRSARAAAVAALRRAHELAADLEAAPLLAELEALAGGAHVTLTVVPAGVPVGPAALSGLTPREREVLGHVVAGRTYREIARALVVSEKTVSVHISNTLRKTGTANRIELAQLVRRLSGPTADG